MKRKLVVLSLLLGLSTATAIVVVLLRPEADDRIGQVCVVPAPTGARDQRLDADIEVYVHVYLHGDLGECISSTSFSRRPTVESVDPAEWKVVGGFVDAGPGPRTPDCGGGNSTATLGKLGPGTYVVESTLQPLRFELPSSEQSVCVSRP